MRCATIDGRLWVDGGRGFVDVAQASGGLFTADPQAVFDRWQEFRQWVDRARPAGTTPVPVGRLGCPVPRPRQMFAVGFNYAEHTAELGAKGGARPVVFPKLPACLAGPDDVVALPSPHVDWEVELAVVIGAPADHVAAEAAWAVVAGLTIGQDLTDRIEQFEGSAPQYSLAKSFPGFGPVGPWLVTVDEFPDPEDLAISCVLNGHVVQESRTDHLIFGVGDLIAFVSGRTPLFPGDIIFTGTPAGIGFARTPPRYLQPDDVLISRIEGIGELVTRFSAGARSEAAR